MVICVDFGVFEEQQRYFNLQKGLYGFDSLGKLILLLIYCIYWSIYNRCSVRMTETVEEESKKIKERSSSFWRKKI
ncbi:hypothetical protein AQUCO_00200890v1 [Aquilegia coerulea]|uniref:Uncharacterized protein n=1 Tax=Aquilegia coerulea TaxID=218851 RepID=A0A2G5F5A9_AQUCA|nr:hypothetical protein AQUCO_00200890v1 [Aquilegia coerulea]